MKFLLLSFAALVLSNCSSCIHEYLGPLMEKGGQQIKMQGERQTAAIVTAISRGEEVRIKDFLAPLALLLGGGTLAGGGALMSRNGNRKRGNNG